MCKDVQPVSFIAFVTLTVAGFSFFLFSTTASKQLRRAVACTAVLCDFRTQSNHVAVVAG